VAEVVFAPELTRVLFKGREIQNIRSWRIKVDPPSHSTVRQIRFDAEVGFSSDCEPPEPGDIIEVEASPWIVNAIVMSVDISFVAAAPDYYVLDAVVTGVPTCKIPVVMDNQHAMAVVAGWAREMGLDAKADELEQKAGPEAMAFVRGLHDEDD
jgi:hypothetical protein